MRFICLALSVLIISNIVAQEKQLALIPWPVEVKQQPGSWHLKSMITVSTDLPAHEWPGLLAYFKGELKKLYGVHVEEAKENKPADIRFEMRRMPTSGKPAYELLVNKQGVVIRSNFAAPAFHAMQTFFQLIPLQGPKYIPFVEIFDHARFDYRGMHLDVARHFFPVSFIKKYIDYLAYHKLNKFHWHLTDDQGWRIEIKKYPALTKVGSTRNGTIIGRYPGKGNDEKRYGGYYTQEEVMEIVRYAKERFIEVIPEIEMPGHASAAIAAFPFLSCFPGQPTYIPANMISEKSIAEQKAGRSKLVQETWGVFDDVFCAGNDSTFTFLQGVIDEVAELFPAKYFHIGGDECPKTHWKKCPKCQQRMRDQGLKDEHELQSYFVQRIGKYLEAKNKTLIGWDEILEGGLAPNAIVMSWRGEAGGIAAAKQKHNVIMTPGNPVYFDHSQSENEDSVTIGGYNPIENVYAYDPIPKELTVEEGKHVLGAQANLWTEYIDNPRKVEYMIFPRMSALSEILWGTKNRKDWQDFERRLSVQFKRYEMWKVNFSRAYFELTASVLPTENYSGVLWKVTSKSGLPISLNYNGNDTIWSYASPQLINQSLTAYAFSNTAGESVKTRFCFNKATGKKIELITPVSPKYPGDGALTLVNGIQNEKGLDRKNEFLGFEGNDCEVIIDLGSEIEITSLTVNALKSRSSWIWEPKVVDAWESLDGLNWLPFKKERKITSFNNEKVRAEISFLPTTVRFVKVLVKNFGTIPASNPGAGNPSWLFVDEIEVK